jgi:hypothetical protein
MTDSVVTLAKQKEVKLLSSYRRKSYLTAVVSLTYAYRVPPSAIQSTSELKEFSWSD